MFCVQFINVAMPSCCSLFFLPEHKYEFIDAPTSISMFSMIYGLVSRKLINKYFKLRKKRQTCICRFVAAFVQQYILERADYFCALFCDAQLCSCDILRSLNICENSGCWYRTKQREKERPKSNVIRERGRKETTTAQLICIKMLTCTKQQRRTDKKESQKYPRESTLLCSSVRNQQILLDNY